MANYVRIYQPVTRHQLIKCMRWCQNILNLRDWHIEFFLGVRDENEKAAGWNELTDAGKWLLQDDIWIDLNYCRDKNTNPYVAVCHEMLHVLINGKCRMESDSDEHIAYTLDDILYEKFCRDNKIKKMPYKEL